MATSAWTPVDENDKQNSAWNPVEEKSAAPNAGLAPAASSHVTPEYANPLPTEKLPLVGPMIQPFGEAAANLNHDPKFRRETYQGAKAGAMAATAPMITPMATGLKVPQLIAGAVGAGLGGYGGQKAAKSLGVGEEGQEIAGDVGGVAGGMAGGLVGGEADPLMRQFGRTVLKTGRNVELNRPFNSLGKFAETWRNESPENVRLQQMAKELRNNSIQTRHAKMVADQAPPPAAMSPMNAAPAGPPPSGVTHVPEPRPNFTGENPNYMASVPRPELGDLAMSRKPGAAGQLQQLGQPILYTPNEAGFPGPRPGTTTTFGQPTPPRPMRPFTSLAPEPTMNPIAKSLWQSSNGFEPPFEEPKVARVSEEMKGRGPGSERRSAARVNQAENDRLFAEARKQLPEDASYEDVQAKVAELRKK